MKAWFVSLLLLAAGMLHAQQVDSICFHLYTDSLKKGVYNYINVDGLLSNGHWLPLSPPKISLHADTGRFTGNNFFIDTGFGGQKVRITVQCGTRLTADTMLYFKRFVPVERLPTNEDVMPARRRNRRTG